MLAQRLSFFVFFFFFLGVNFSISLSDKLKFESNIRIAETYNQITLGKGGYPHHPVNKMWLDYPDALAYYHNMCIDEWIKRGYNNTMKHIVHVKDFKRPEWIGDERIHKSHRSYLLRKDYEFYSQYGWNEPTNIEYYWVD